MRLLIITLLTLCGTAQATTVQGLLDALNAKTGVVLSAWIDVTPAVMPRSDLHLGTIAWVEIADGAVTKQVVFRLIPLPSRVHPLYLSLRLPPRISHAHQLVST